MTIEQSLDSNSDFRSKSSFIAFRRTVSIRWLDSIPFCKSISYERRNWKDCKSNASIAISSGLLPSKFLKNTNRLVSWLKDSWICVLVKIWLKSESEFRLRWCKRLLFLSKRLGLQMRFNCESLISTRPFKIPYRISVS